MKNKNVDSIRKVNTIKRQKLRAEQTAKGPLVSYYISESPFKFILSKKQRKFRIKDLDAISQKVFSQSKAQARKIWFLAYHQRSIPILAAVIALVLAFSGGVWATLATSQSSADDSMPVSQTSQPPLQVRGAPVADASAPNQELFNMSISQLENYFSDLAESNQKAQHEQLLAERKEKLKAYLQEKNSPLAEIVDTIAELKHWKLVLAISNSESSLGKRCYNNNCSGIGVQPGDPAWRDYGSKKEWAEDLDRLIEKRYKDWSLEEMNGVYNKPGSQNWVSAATQILEELKDRGIE